MRWVIRLTAGLALVGGAATIGTAVARSDTRPSAERAAPEAPAARAAAPTALPVAVLHPAPPAAPADLTQTADDLAHLPRGGRVHCGPVAVSNWLVALAARGWPRLLPEGPDVRSRQIRAVDLLSSRALMATGPWSGTGTHGLLVGLHRWVRRSGYELRRLEYQGWRGHHPRYTTGVRVPQMSFVHEGLERGGAAWLHVGWYRKLPRSEMYQRSGGHWLAVARAPDDSHLVLHDSAPWAGPEGEGERVQVELLERGWLFARGSRSGLKAAGYARLVGGMHVKHEGDSAIVDGAIVLELEPAETLATSGDD